MALDARCLIGRRITEYAEIKGERKKICLLLTLVKQAPDVAGKHNKISILNITNNNDVARRSPKRMSYGYAPWSSWRGTRTKGSRRERPQRFPDSPTNHVSKMYGQ